MVSFVLICLYLELIWTLNFLCFALLCGCLCGCLSINFFVLINFLCFALLCGCLCCLSINLDGLFCFALLCFVVLYRLFALLCCDSSCSCSCLLFLQLFSQVAVCFVLYPVLVVVVLYRLFVVLYQLFSCSLWLPGRVFFDLVLSHWLRCCFVGVLYRLFQLSCFLQSFRLREFELDQKQKDLVEKRKGLFDEMVQIPGLIRVEAMNAAMKMVADESKLSLFYACPNNEWKKDFILNLVHPDLPPSNQSG